MKIVTNTNVYGLEESLIASGYPMSTDVAEVMGYITGDDFKRANKLGNAKAGSGHDCFLKGIIVQYDLTVPQYIWMQMERYHFADIISSQSKMHRITRMDIDQQCNAYVLTEIKLILKDLITRYNETPNEDKKLKKHLFNRIISNCPMGYLLTARMTTNYLQLKTIYNQRKHHKMDEWHEICAWIETLPYFKEFCLEG